jgi:hypothetical protein
MCLGAGGAPAQSPAGRLVEAARAQLGVPNPDSAATLLQAALRPGSGASIAEQARAFVLYGVAELLLDNVAGARAAFGQALQRDPTLRVDSLAFFTDALEREFNAERAAVALPPTAARAELLAVEADVPLDTTVSPIDGRLRISARPTRRATVAFEIATFETPSRVLWSDTQVIAVERAVHWNLRKRDGSLVAPGRYQLRVAAIDSLGRLARGTEGVLVITRVSVDSIPMPPPLSPSVFAPETLRVRPGSPYWLVAGLSMGFAGFLVVTDCTDAPRSCGSDRPYFVGLGLGALGGVVAFLTGHRSRFSIPNMRRNMELRLQDAQRRAAIAEANSLAASGPLIHIQIEGLRR